MMALMSGFRLESVPFRELNVFEGNQLTRRFSVFGGVDLGGRRIDVYHDKVGSPVWYAAALHEIGHLQRIHESYLYAHTAKPVDEAYLREELLAWEWARRNAIYWDDEMDAVRNLAMESYYDAYVETLAKRYLGTLQRALVESSGQGG